MEAEEISVVLSRASDLHAKIDLAIDRILKSAVADAVPCSGSSPRRRGGNAAGERSCGDPRLQSGEVEREENDVDVEVRSLVSIRDALEILEEQLEALQALEHQQRVERDTGLTEIEESRRTLLSRLKEHRGRDPEVVQEALTFVGETSVDNDDLHLPPYPRQPSQFITAAGSFSASRSGGITGMAEKLPVRSEVVNFDEEEAAGSDLDLQPLYQADSKLRGSFDAAINSIKNSGAFVVNAVKHSAASAFGAVMDSGTVDFAVNSAKYSAAVLNQICGKVTGRSSKVLFVVVGAVAVLSLNEIGRKIKRRRAGSTCPMLSPHGSPYNSHHPSHAMGQKASTKSKSTHHHPIDKGKVHFKDEGSVSEVNATILDESFPRCVVRERTELPFYQELKMPDALYGRG